MIVFLVSLILATPLAMRIAFDILNLTVDQSAAQAGL
jgi:hypothetical protein